MLSVGSWEGEVEREAERHKRARRLELKGSAVKSCRGLEGIPDDSATVYLIHSVTSRSKGAKAGLLGSSKLFSVLCDGKLSGASRPPILSLASAVDQYRDELPLMSNSRL